MKRSPPLPLVFLVTVFYYLLAVPCDWILKKVLRKRGLFLGMTGGRKKMEKRILAAFDGYTPTAHDVIIGNFSKSGTNWSMQMAFQIACLGDGEYRNIHDVVPWPDFPAPNARRIIRPLDDTTVQDMTPTHLRVIKTHLAANHVPYNDQARYISVIRDPKDIFVSSYFFLSGMFGVIMPTLDDWLDAFLSDDFPISFGVSWAQHVASYWAWRDRPNVLILAFRDMKKDLPGTVRQVADLMEVELSEPQFNRVVEKCSFDYMKAIDERFLPTGKKPFPWMTASMVRSGKEGNSRELITLAQQERIDDYFIARLQALGSDFPYTDFCRLTLTL